MVKIIETGLNGSGKSKNILKSDDDKLNVAAMYMDKTACDYFLWWDSTMKGGRLVRDWDTFKKYFFKWLKTWKNSKYTTSSLVYNKKELWMDISENYWSLPLVSKI